MKNKLTKLIIITLILRVIFLFAANDHLKLNPDEEHNFKIAENYHKGLGYVAYDPETGTVRTTAFHGSFPVFISKFLIENDIQKSSYIIFIYIFTLILFTVSVPAFHKLCLLFLQNERIAFFATVTYCIYPSILYYIGSVFFYENIGLALLIIVMQQLLTFTNKNYTYFFIPIAVSLSCLLRPQMIVVFLFVFLVFLWMNIRKEFSKALSLALLTIVVVITSNIPGLIKNKELFGDYILSTQSGYEFLQGHNPVARGSWIGDWQDSTNALYQYSHANISNIAEMNEWQESQARKKLAIEWIKDNPGNELVLVIRKLVIYFLPKNFGSFDSARIINPINLLTHLFFVCALLFMLFKRKINLEAFYLLTPVIASIALTLIFFVGYRWRYYAEPFMIIFAWYFLMQVKNKKAPGTSG